MIESTLINICGNIASGKSTVAAAIADSFNLAVVVEDTTRISLFNSYCLSPSKWAAGAQLQFLLDKILRIIGHGERPAVLVDRSIWEDVNIFARAHLAIGNISAAQYESYIEIYRNAQIFLPMKEVTIFVRCSRIEQLRRISFREQQEREMLTVPYLDRLSEMYNDFEIRSEFDFFFDSEKDPLKNLLDFVSERLKRL